MNIFLLAAVVSEATLLRMGPSSVSPSIDGTISRAEIGGSSVQYGPVSTLTGLMTVRYGTFFFAYGEKGFYFAARTSVPPRPQKLTVADVVTLTLQSPDETSPVSFVAHVKDGSVDGQPKSVRCAVRHPKGLEVCGVECAETELFIPYGTSGLRRPVDGEKWGLQMSVSFSSAAETGLWHQAVQPGELGMLIADSSCPIPSFLTFSSFELWRPRGGYWMHFRFANNGDREMALTSDSVVHRGIGFAKLDDNPEKAEGVIHHRMDEMNGKRIAPGETLDLIHPEYSLWPGSVNDMRINVFSDGRLCFRRRLRWDLACGFTWTDAENLPTLDAAFYPSRENRLRARYQSNGVKDLVRGAITVVNAEGERFFFRRFVGEPYLIGEELDVRLPNLPLGDYRVRFAASNAVGRVYTDERTFSVRSFPWQGNTLGKERVIIPPFRALQTTDSGVDFLQTGYRFGGILWDEVRAQGENILAAPVQLTLNGRSFDVSGVCLIESADDRLVRQVMATCEDVELTVVQDYDYDGFCKVTLTFVPRTTTTVKSLRLKIPLKDGLARFFDVCQRNNKRAYAAPNFTLPSGAGVVWTSDVNAPPALRELDGVNFQPYVWWGGASKGFCWMMNSIKGLCVDAKRPVERIVRANDAATLEVDLVNVKTVWDKPIAFVMGFQPTPVKPQNVRLNRLAKDTFSGYMCPSNAIRTMYSNATTLGVSTMLYPILEMPNGDTSFRDWLFAQRTSDWDAYSAQMDAFIDRNKRWFAEESRITAQQYRRENVVMRQMTGARYREFYLDPILISCFWPEDEMYKSEWGVYEWPRDNYMNEYGGKITSTRIDKMIYDAWRALQVGYNAIYYDCFGCHRDYNFVMSPERAYRKSNGRIQLGCCDLFEQREIIRRTAILCHLNGGMILGTPAASAHTTDCFVVPVMSFASSAVVCERGAMGGDWQERFPESYMLTEVCGRQAGVIPHVIASARVGDQKRRAHEMNTLMAMMCAYGFFHLFDQNLVYVPSFEKAWNVVFDFGWGHDDVKIRHFYDDGPLPVVHDGRDVRLTVAQKAESALLLFGNLGETTSVRFDCTGLGYGRPCATDAMTGIPVDMRELEIARHGYRIVRVDDTAGK